MSSKTNTDQVLAVLASPIRREIRDRLKSSGPATASALAMQMGRSTPSVIYHLRQLEAAGLVERAGRRGPDGERYRASKSPLAIETDDEGSAIADATIERSLRQARREFLRDKAEDDRVFFVRETAFLTEAEVAKAREHLACISRLMARGRRRAGARLFTMTGILQSVAEYEPKAVRRPKG